MNNASPDPRPRRRLFWDVRPPRVADRDEALPPVAFREQLSFDPHLSDQKVRRAVEQLQTSIERMEVTSPVVRRRMPQYYRVAAAVGTLLVAGAALYLLYGRPSTQRWATAYGETRELWLPDSSHVILNANSSLRYATDWQAGTTREVYLEGEAFFEVRKQPNPAGGVKFVVHTDEVEVEVLGTRFDVWKRQQKTQVMLQEGRIRLRIEKRPEEIVMQPGELVEVSRDARQVVQRMVNPQEYGSWKDRQLIFHERPLADIMAKIEELYGTQVVADADLHQIRLTGTFPTDNLEALLELLSASTGLQVTRENQAIRLHR
ncbi:ferric-dicitrate binding protein FerR, regulates iron transport through sigma-19 [Catalinimonas alkaloidigena]|uniref:Ferric-dicitrate binding protein FerR, regulates iron transport through sigma-19 n=1 Tax=Catalinimonas alkaloidigena TaxID=1075417 RepID=A0A1G8XII2_9BACT|nr:FecR domain-containing protein [Catalinimonas alkaloidigena]SDJ90402.1 ferric-dicitrate binding protein FerR, regulates iron transport through sigma-19 [Catalinimonas alkaloidigena]